MKTRFITQVVMLMLLVVVVGTACRSSRPTRRPHTKVIVVERKSLPPGQAKKIYGTKSAKVFAPGQQKKRNAHYKKKKHH